MRQVITILFIFILVKVSGQQSLPNRTGFICHIPFFIESELFIRESVNYHPDGKVEIIIPIVSPGIRVSIPLGSISYSVIHRIDYRTSLKKHSLHEVEYKLEGLGYDSTLWHEIPMQLSGNADSILCLIDTLVGNGNSFSILFKEHRGKYFR